MWVCGWPVLKWSTATQSSLVPRSCLHLRHQPADERLEVRILVAILGRDDEAELMAVLAAALEERLAVGDVLPARIEPARLALAGHAVALDIAQMRAGAGQPLAGEPHQPRLHDHPARAQAGMPVAAGQHAADAGAAPDPAAVEPAVTDAGANAGPPRSGDDQSEIFAAMLRLPRVRAPKAWLEIVLIHGRAGAYCPKLAHRRLPRPPARGRREALLRRIRRTRPQGSVPAARSERIFAHRPGL